MTTTTREAQIEQYRTDLVGGRLLALRCMSAKSRSGYAPAMSSRSYAQAMEVVARFAGIGDWGATLASKVLCSVNLYATPGQAIASVSDALRVEIAEGWDDVRGRTGPEAGRPSSHHYPTTLRNGILALLLASEVAAALGDSPRIGWALSEVMEAEGMTIDPRLFPRLAVAN